MLKLKLQFFVRLMRRADSLEKTLMLGGIEGRRMPGASMRNSAHGKGHEEGGFGIRKGGIQPQETPCSLSIYPQNQSLPTLLLYALTYTSDFTGGCPPPLSEKELTYSSS